jgi:hypothetical protein
MHYTTLQPLRDIEIIILWNILAKIETAILTEAHASSTSIYCCLLLLLVLTKIKIT